MHKEYDDLIKNETWKLVDLRFRTQPIGYKWVFKNKYKSDGSLYKHKERLMEKGYAKKEASIMKRPFPPQQNGLPSRLSLLWQLIMDGKSIKWM